jgi:hypothetical protein
LHVDDGLALDFNCLFQLAYCELRIHCRREPCRQNDIGTLNRLEPAGSHSQLIRAGWQQVKKEAAVRVSFGASRNHQSWAVNLNRGVRHDGAGSVGHYPSDLSGCGDLGRQQDRQARHGHNSGTNPIGP